MICLARFLDEIQYTCGDSFYDIASNDTNDSMKKLFSIVKVNNTLTCNSPIEIPYYIIQTVIVCQTKIKEKGKEKKFVKSKEQEVFHSKLYDFNIPNNIDDFNKSNKRNSKSSKVITMIRGDSEKLPEEFIKLQINSNDDEKEITQQHIDDDDEVYNNPNLHSKEQDELEIPDDGF
ncbi:unnamed protein product [Rhizophagus irregularis]|nr:unnamed protein product [Rhizophagus irregularis]